MHILNAQELISDAIEAYRKNPEVFLSSLEYIEKFSTGT